MIVQQPPPAAEVDAALARVFERAEFAEHRVPVLVQFIRDVWSAVRQWFFDLMRIVLPDADSDTLTWVLLIVLIAAAAWALFHLIGSMLGGGTTSRARSQPPVGMKEHDAAWWEAAARTAAREARYRDAVLALYTATVLRLEQKGEVRYHPGKTPGDYRREVSDSATRPPFDRFVRELLPAAFGAQPPDAAAFEALRVHATALGVRA